MVRTLYRNFCAYSLRIFYYTFLWSNLYYDFVFFYIPCYSCFLFTFNYIILFILLKNKGKKNFVSNYTKTDKLNTCMKRYVTNALEKLWIEILNRHQTYSEKLHERLKSAIVRELFNSLTLLRECSQFYSTLFFFPIEFGLTLWISNVKSTVKSIKSSD